MIIENHPRVITRGLSTQNWLFDYNSNLGLTTNVNGLTAWSDQRGNVGDLASANDTLSPDVITNGNPNGDGNAIEFNGVGESMKVSGGFTWNQPETLYLVFKQITWGLNRQITDGESAGSFNFLTQNVTPDLNFNAGLFVGNNSDLAVDTWGVACIVANGASSSIRINNNAKVTGNCGVTNAGGFTLGSKSNQTEFFANISVARVLGYDTSPHSDNNQTQNINALKNEYNVTF